MASRARCSSEKRARRSSRAEIHASASATILSLLIIKMLRDKREPCSPSHPSNAVMTCYGGGAGLIAAVCVRHLQL
eukprot:6194230-Pleurochrysis_carterae.AAC.1